MTPAAAPYRQLTVRTSGPEDTRALAAAVTEGIREGDAVVLTGELGAGKTVFAQGVARALGVERRVTSPTFTILRRYEGDVRLVHVDVYRLNEMQDFVELGEESLLGPDEVTLIEWGDTVTPLLPRDRLEVELLLGDGGDDERIAHLRGHGAWSARIADLLADLGPWLLDEEREA